MDALAEALIFPTHSDPWGLVVNEAMACGLPVIASKVAGCVADLVQDGENGWVLSSSDPEGLSQAMQQLLGDRELIRQMGRRSLERSSRFTPQTWAAGMVRAACEVGDARG